MAVTFYSRTLSVALIPVQSDLRNRHLSNRRIGMASNQKFIGTAQLIAFVAILSFGCGAPRRPVAPSQVNASFYGAPQLMPILGTPVTYVANATREIIRDGNLFYLRIWVPASETEDVYYHDFWFSSANVDGPWQAVPAVPEEVAQVECTELGPYNPIITYQLCTVPFPYP